MQENRTEFRSKHQLAINFCVEKWLLTDAIPSEEQFLSSFVPDCKSKHAAEMLRTVRTVLIVGVDNRLSIAVCIKGVAEFFELFAQLEVVIDFTVKDDPGCAITVVNGLLTTLEVNDRQASHRQTDRAIDVESVFVGTTVTNCLVHPSQQSLVNRFSVVSNESYDATHMLIGFMTFRGSEFVSWLY